MFLKKNVDLVIGLLKEDEQAEINSFISNPVPKNNKEFIALWCHYFSLKLNHEKIVSEFLNSHYADKYSWEFHYLLAKKYNETLNDSLNSKIEQLQFIPRLDKYISIYDWKFKNEVKTLILTYLYILTKGDTSYISLQSLAKNYNLSFEFIQSLDYHHQLFKDQILIFKEDILSKEKSFLDKEIIFQSAIYKIFADITLTENEIASILGNPLLELFNIVENFHIEETNEIFHQDDFEDEFDEESFNIEELWKNDTSSTSKLEETESTEEDADQAKPYKDNLDYLYNEYLWISHLKEIYNIKTDQLKSEDEQNSCYLIEQKINRQRNICSMRLQISKKNGFIPRVESLAQKLKLREIEKNILKVLVVKSIFVPKDNYRLSNTIKVGELLYVLIDDEVERVKEKKVFLKTAKLVKFGLIQLDTHKPWDEDIYGAYVTIDNRLLEYFCGENFDISDYLDGGYLYKPKLNLENVIVNENKTNKILELIENFPTFLQTKKKLDFTNIGHYGNSLVMLFVGPSGTGKTMMANAIVKYLNQKILVFNMNNIEQIATIPETNKIFSMLFRETRINDAVLFFDESEFILQNRINDLLLEIEKHEGIVIFATNASFKIDEAMRRRINLIVHFEEPTPKLRKKIWEIHLPKNIKVSNDVNLEYIAKKYELNGGLIKNAVFTALSKAINESNNGSTVLKQHHLIEGADEQLHNKLFMTKMNEQIVPMQGLESVILPSNTLESLTEIMNNDKAKKVLYNEWGFKEVYPESKGMSVLFYGESGTGKTLAAKAIAYETGKTLKIVNYSQVISMWVGETGKALEHLLKEIAGSKSILLFDEADALFAQRTGINSSNDRYANSETDVLLSLIERFNVFAILTTNHIENIDKAFFRRMDYMVEFKAPDYNGRIKLWNKLIPKQMPLNKNVNIEQLAQMYNFNGGDIRNVVHRAANKRALSTSDSREVMMKDFIDVCNEITLSKKGKTLSKIGFN